MPQLSDLEKKALLSLQAREKGYHSLMQKQLASSLNQIYDKWAIDGKLTK